MNCSEYEELFGGHVEGLLDQAAESRLDAHLRECPACAEGLDDARRVFDRLRADLSSPSLGDQVMDRIFREQTQRLRKYSRLKGLAGATVAVALLVWASVALWSPGSSPGGKVYADDFVIQARRQGSQARSSTWKTSYYLQYRSPDGRKSKWLRVTGNEQESAYRAPGLYHVQTRDEKGVVAFTSTEDIVSRSKLELDFRNKAARLRYVAEGSFSREGPFATALGMLQSEELQALGKKEIGGRTANGFRLAFFTEAHNQKWSYEVWIDAETKRLVSFQVPGADLFNPADVVEAGPGRNHLANSIQVDGATWVRPQGLASGGFVMHDIALDVEIDEALFRLTPPEGFAVKAVGAPVIKETDVVEFMRIVAEYFDGKFPAKMPHFNHGPVEYDRFEKVEHDVIAKRPASPAETRMVEAMHRWWSTGIPGPGPMHIFIHQQIVDGSWKYLGQGVELGDASRIVCWYRLKDSPTYRVVYGDLSIKDVAPEGLPLPVER